MRKNTENRDSEEFRRWAQSAYAPREEKTQFLTNLEDKFSVDGFEEVDIRDSESRQRFVEAVEEFVRKLLLSA